MLRISQHLSLRLLVAFVLQIIVISATAVVGVKLAELAIREILIVSALEQEADYFWARQRIDSDTPAPNTHKLIGYIFEEASATTLPSEFEGLNNGIHEVSTLLGDSVVHVSQQDGRTLYLVFDAGNIQQLVTYFGIAPLALLLIVLYSAAWIAYRIARRAVSPVIKLARSVRNIDVEAPDIASLRIDRGAKAVDDEVWVLSQALQHLVERTNLFLERERNFTREASHELRSPLTVIRLASETLLSSDGLDGKHVAAIKKIRAAAMDMEELTEVLLLLAREHHGELSKDRVLINDLVAKEMAHCAVVYEAKNIKTKFVEEGELVVEGSAKILSVVFGNIMRNAFAYTDEGEIEITIDGAGVVITDSGIGISKEQLGQVFHAYFRASNSRESGHGIGLTLVKRIMDRFGWHIEISSEPDRGTCVSVHFPQAEFTQSTEGKQLRAAAR